MAPTTITNPYYGPAQPPPPQYLAQPPPSQYPGPPQEQWNGVVPAGSPQMPTKSPLTTIASPYSVASTPTPIFSPISPATTPAPSAPAIAAAPAFSAFELPADYKYGSNPIELEAISSRPTTAHGKDGNTTKENWSPLSDEKGKKS
jgi:hypothetical protein